MLTSIEDQINLAEERLRLAMLASDVAELDELISDNLIFTTHLGQVFSKQEDLELHGSGEVDFQKIEPSEQVVSVGNGFAVVSVRIRIAGTYCGTPIDDDLRYTRVWHLEENNAWRIFAGHISSVQQ
ncbi:nuclear transport factor 2 family protein [Merismopedia glauca]|uniref:DUF4440 domain-containing protein n=1 Tax=Merismopedia glauca CCAP 1448/3 TaxID=1296344 RepID=A0A2T1C9G5_9CYAN|nr:nuclear transport factor 2 family protein [Merismopedia glauca]PSB04889.1 DUF4440 domain-containing protein [Merismopedia glauca CCAP 1448/3]